MSRRSVTPDPAPTNVEIAVRQAARERRKGRHRKAMLHLKRAAFEAGDRPGLWNRYALSCVRAGRLDDAKRAFAQAIWLLERAGRCATAELTRRLERDAESGELPTGYARQSWKSPAA